VRRCAPAGIETLPFLKIAYTALHKFVLLVEIRRFGMIANAHAHRF
jgi:hypothetical protein